MAEDREYSPLDYYNTGAQNNSIFSRPNIIVLDTNTENIQPTYLDQVAIRELGFLRSSPEKRIYSHTTKPRLYLEEKFIHNLQKKDFMDRVVDVYYYDNDGIMSKHYLYSSNKPNKEEIATIIENI